MNNGPKENKMADARKLTWKLCNICDLFQSTRVTYIYIYTQRYIYMKLVTVLDQSSSCEIRSKMNMQIKEPFSFILFYFYWSLGFELWT